ncbi:MAG: hypothetical protein Harvfovirus17_13 [Harvfovirus sp.]|uniref:Sel1 repeat family protein n=1 Tax=Harvfovirus sp. TaxID=2487768 RepID=A0A3G5A6N4_9VIRU|nr:MAG: hypothetical protein Harvfovirus17_13 [Harvfovirus sp.]
MGETELMALRYDTLADMLKYTLLLNDNGVEARKKIFVLFNIKVVDEKKIADLYYDVFKFYFDSVNFGGVVGRSVLDSFSNGKMKATESYKKVMKFVKLGGRHGNSNYIELLALMYYYGLVLKRNCEKALRWLYLGVALENATCAAYLGNMLLSGKEVKKDEEKALSLFKLSAGKNNRNGIIGLGKMFLFGEGVNYPESFRLFGLVADDSEGMKFLAYMYLRGFGVDHDEKKGFELFKLSAERGNNYAQINVGLCYENGWGVEVDLLEGMKWMKLSAEDGNPHAQNYLGQTYYHGSSKLPRNYTEALKWIRLSADKNYPDAIADLGVMYYYGHGVKADLVRGKELFEKAAGMGLVRAESLIGTLYLNGVKVKQDYVRAFEIFSSSAKRGCSLGMEGVASMYYHGCGVRQDYKEAAIWYERSYGTGECTLRTIFKLGIMYLEGLGLVIDKVKALKMFKIAVSKGHEESEKYYDSLKDTVELVEDKENIVHFDKDNLYSDGFF